MSSSTTDDFSPFTPKALKPHHSHSLNGEQEQNQNQEHEKHAYEDDFGQCKCLPRALREYGPASLWQEKHRVEDMYGKFWELDPQYDMVNDSQFDREEMYKLMVRIHEDAHLGNGGISIAFQGLSVEVPIEVLPEVKTVEMSALGLFYKIRELVRKWRTRSAEEQEEEKRKQSMEHYMVLNNVSGFVKEGETLLILSPPASGSSSLLNILGLRGGHFKRRSGTVTYNGMDIYTDSTIMRVLKHLVRYVGETDVHFASLSVYSTLQFAARCMYPSFFPYAEYLRQSKVFGVVRALGIDKTLGTAVGDNILRGVSGGEKKRVTIAEMFVGYGGRVYLLDNMTSGLDSSASFDICQSITKLAKNFQATFVCSLQQPSYEMFSLFDRLLVLDHGKALFFGRPQDAQRYFESLGFIKPPYRSVPDFIATVSHPKAFDTLVDPNKIETAPRTLDDFEKRYQESEYYQECLKEIQDGIVGGSQRFNMGIKERLSPDVWKWLSRDCLNPDIIQTYLLFLRALRLEFLDRHNVKSSLMSSIIVGLVFGTLFFDMPLDQSGLYLRAGLLFLSTIFNSLAAMGSLNKKYQQKRVFEKQTAAGFYTAGPYVLASTLVDVFMTLIRIFLFSSCSYWLAGFNRSGGRYGIYLLVLWLLSTVMDSFVRLLSTVLSQDACTAVAGAILVMFVVFCGFLLNPDTIPPWFIWLFYLSPLHYAIEALFLNEFSGLQFFCTPSEMLPPDPNLAGTGVQFCPITSGNQYITNVIGWNSGFQWVWINIGILCAFLAFFLGTATLAMRFKKPKEYGYRTLNDSTLQDDRDIVERNIRAVHRACRRLEKKVFGKKPVPGQTGEDQPARSSSFAPSDDEEASSAVQSGESRHESEAIKVRPAYVVWKDISYTVPIKKRESKVLLSHVDGFARPGKMTALMGSSGAGKTTLLDVLAQRKTKGEITGTIEINRLPQDANFSRYSGYVEQMDIHYERLTVRESLLFSAQLRLPEAWSKEVKEEIVDRALRTLMLDDIRDRLVGTAGGLGLTAEQRKRLTIAVELVGNPSIIFLDEPTTGLSAREALMVIRVIRRVANMGVSVICTIHQPSSEIFSEFDELLLLQRGGETVYCGEIGPAGKTLVDYFVRNGAPPLLPNQNPAEYMLLQIGAGLTVKDQAEKKDWHQIWKDSDESKRLNDMVNDIAVDMSDMLDPLVKRKTAFLAHPAEVQSASKAKSQEELGVGESAMASDSKHESEMHHLVPKDIEPLLFESRFTTTRLYQYRKVSERALLMAWRTPEYNWTRIGISIFQSLLFGLAFFQLDHNQKGIAMMPAALFMSGLSAMMQMMNVIRPMMSNRDVFYRELAAGLYNEYAYHISNMVAELPFAILGGLLFEVIYYFLVGLTPSRFGYFLLTNMLFLLWAIFLGQAICTFAANISTALHIPPLVNTLGNVLAGFIIRKPTIPPWYVWLYWSDPVQYYNTGVIINEMANASFSCSPSEYVVFNNPDPSQPCSALNHGSFVYYDGPNASTCKYCSIQNGNMLLARYGIGGRDKW
eukprot:CAMPEP_0184693522 /NCGR_PEP_ID=MMETSP0313-20130426/1714_1 /TAXON_ID=2792 /ORGANISM="Porphyridium aerugineum, Strain SAG 1380-2" /LENGTH=1525 /DNA_ID=CAMNT_0027151613 /DNA_START=498 /DNA_END=5072 /DNA_ORIENTATION=+